MSTIGSRRDRDVKPAFMAWLLASVALTAHAQQWTFGVYLDDKRIGTHRFDVTHEGDDAVRVTSRAEFDVTVLRIPVFRYRHSAVEIWRSGCLEAIDTTTEVNGQRSTLTGRPNPTGFEVEVRSKDGAQRQALPACVASFAYWDAATLRRHRELLNGQTGAYQPVAQTAFDPGDAARLALVGRDFRIDLGYAGDDGRWQWLRTQTPDGRHLEYRLESN